MALIDIGGHTVEDSLLKDGCIIDIGCRGFSFTGHPLFKGKRIYAIDPDEEVFKDAPNGITLLNLAIWNEAGEKTYYRNGEATCIQEVWEPHKHLHFPCRAITMDMLYEITGYDVDVLKLDCEGAEYHILDESFEPIPKQISIEFHYHCMAHVHNEKIDGILKRLGKSYEAKNLVWEARYGAGFNFWDVLFIRKC